MPSGFISSNEPLRELRREAFLLDTMEAARDVDITLSFSLWESFTGQGSEANSIRFMRQLKTGRPVRCTRRLALRKF